jgi:hypothetical protein
MIIKSYQSGGLENAVLNGGLQECCRGRICTAEEHVARRAIEYRCSRQLKKGGKKKRKVVASALGGAVSRCVMRAASDDKAE